MVSDFMEFNSIIRTLRQKMPFLSLAVNSGNKAELMMKRQM